MTSYVLFFPNIDPIIFTIGPFSVYWYGLMYCISFLFAIWFLLRRLNYVKINCTAQDIGNLLHMSIWGILFGGRIGYIVFYSWDIFLEDIFFLFKIWEGGMSFHGGLIGMILVLFFFSHSTKINFFEVSDFIIPVIPFGLGAGRLGNFINGELWGRVNIKIPWAMLFPSSKSLDALEILVHPEWYSIFNYYGGLPRHPSQLYEMFFEGIVLFIIFNFCLNRKYPNGMISGFFLFLYGIIRIFVEFFREPDLHLGLFKGMFSLGQILSVPMVILGILIMIIVSYFNK